MLYFVLLHFLPLFHLYSIMSQVDGTQYEDDSKPVSVPDTGDAGESGKLKMIVSLVKKVVGVKDIASMYVASTSILRSTHVPQGDYHCQHPCWSLFPTSSIGITLTVQICLRREYRYLQSSVDVAVLTVGQHQ